MCVQRAVAVEADAVIAALDVVAVDFARRQRREAMRAAVAQNADAAVLAAEDHHAPDRRSCARSACCRRARNRAPRHTSDCADNMSRSWRALPKGFALLYAGFDAVQRRANRIRASQTRGALSRNASRLRGEVQIMRRRVTLQKRFNLRFIRPSRWTIVQLARLGTRVGRMQDMITRKHLLRSAGAFALADGGRRAAARGREDYPSQDIHLICGFPPGSGADIFVRYFGEKLRPVAGRNGDRRKQGRRQQQHRDRIRRALEARRLHALSVRRHDRRGNHGISSRIRRSTSARPSRWRPRPAISPSCCWSTPRAPTRPSPN